jgi:hypothetical protein
MVRMHIIVSKIVPNRQSNCDLKIYADNIYCWIINAYIYVISNDIVQ